MSTSLRSVISANALDAGDGCTRSEYSLFRWQGASRFWYVHSVIPGLFVDWDSPANYAFVRRSYDGYRNVLYFGIAQSLSRRLKGHEKMDEAIRLGANELHVHLLANNEYERGRVEIDLIRGHSPKLNVQHNLFLEALGITGTQQSAENSPFALGLGDVLSRPSNSKSKAPSIWDVL